MKVNWDYSEKAFVVQGETKECKDELAALGGKFNAMLRDGPGWVFSKKNREKVEEFMKRKGLSTTSGTRSVPSTTEDSTKKADRPVSTKASFTPNELSSSVLQNSIKYLSAKSADERMNFVTELLSSLRAIDLQKKEPKSPAINESSEEDETPPLEKTKPLLKEIAMKAPITTSKEQKSTKKMTIETVIVPKKAIDTDSDVCSSDEEDDGKSVPRKRLLS